MLNRSVCRKCHVIVYSQIYKNDKLVKDAIRNFHNYWETSHKCYCLHFKGYVSVFCKPPDECPYMLEQIVADHDIKKTSLP